MPLPSKKLAWAAAGDVVLIAGKGHETGQTRDGQTHPFDDRVELAAALEAMPSPANDARLADYQPYWAALAELTSEVQAARPGEPFDLVVGITPDDDPVPWARAGATWIVTDLGLQPTEAQVREVIESGPR